MQQSSNHQVYHRSAVFPTSPWRKEGGSYTGLDPHPVEVGIGPTDVALSHEEADVLMVYHMIQETSNGHKTIKVVSDDTDMLLFLAHHQHAHTGNIYHLPFMFYWRLASKPHSYRHEYDVVKKPQKILPNSLTAHALTGCDTVSCLSGIGKTSVIKKLEASMPLSWWGILHHQPTALSHLARSLLLLRMGMILRDHLTSKEDIYSRGRLLESAIHLRN